MRDFLLEANTPTMVDVGANVGHHSLFASTVASHVHSFEPYPPVRKRLEEKIRINKLGNVTIHPFGLGNENDTILFSPPTDNNMGTGSFLSDENNKDFIPLNIRRADDYFEDAGIHKIDYLKMDVEGFEVEALQGVKNTLVHSRPVVFFEWTQVERENDSAPEASLFPSGYSFFKFGTNKPFMVFFNHRTYRLRKLEQSWNDVNILAVPNELIEKIKTQKPASKLARILKNA